MTRGLEAWRGESWLLLWKLRRRGLGLGRAAVGGCKPFPCCLFSVSALSCFYLSLPCFFDIFAGVVPLFLRVKIGGFLYGE
jgi:hypothetical protein